MPSIEFRGQKVEYDLTALTNYGVQKALAMAEMNDKWYQAVSRILCGKDVEVIESIGGDMVDDLGPLLADIGADAAKRSKTAKN